MKSRCLDAVAVVVLVATVTSPARCLPAERPNIVLILADDLGPEWLGCYGSEARVTPNIDRLAAEGMRFEHVWATPLCTPTRHELLTGRYPFRTGWTVHHDTPRWGGQYFDWRREITFARVLRDAGYRTAIAGKWQINDLRSQPDALARHGFEEHCVWPGFESDSPRTPERYFDPLIQRQGERPRLPERFGPDIFTDFIIDFVRRHRDGPFLAYYAMVLTHTPFTRTPASGAADDRGAALYPGMVSYADNLVGKVLQALDELGLRRRTLVIFTTDNGSPGGVSCRALGRDIRGGKGKLTETGIAVPLIVSWPGHIPAGVESTALADFSDILPTLVDVAGASLPADRQIDGRSLAALFDGRNGRASGRRWIFSQYGARRVIRDRRYKLWSDGRFFDLEADPEESMDLRDSDDAAVAQARAALRKVLESLPEDAKLPFPPRKTGTRR